MKNKHKNIKYFFVAIFLIAANTHLVMAQSIKLPDFEIPKHSPLQNGLTLPRTVNPQIYELPSARFLDLLIQSKTHKVSVIYRHKNDTGRAQSTFPYQHVSLNDVSPSDLRTLLLDHNNSKYEICYEPLKDYYQTSVIRIAVNSNTLIQLQRGTLFFNDTNFYFNHQKIDFHNFISISSNGILKEEIILAK